MVRHYLNTAFRILWRNKAFSAINMMGLALGLACSLLIMLWVNDEYHVDAFHENRARLYSVYERQNHDGQWSAFHATPAVLADEMKRVLPEVEYATNYSWNEQAVFEAGGKIIQQSGTYAGADFFKMFSYHLLAGDATKALQTPSHIAIFKKKSDNFFGSPAEAIGKTIRYQNKRDFRITAVFDNVPQNSTAQFEYILNWQTFLDSYFKALSSLFKDDSRSNEWTDSGPACYIMLREGVDVRAFEKKIERFLDNYNKEQTPADYIRLGIQRYDDIYLHSNFDGNGNISGGRIQYVRLFSLVVVFILLIACINFMNLSIARFSNRGKEVGVRKVMGAEKKNLVFQFLGESVVISIIAGIIGIGVIIIFIPVFNELAQTNVEVSQLLDPINASGIIAIILITGILAGIYPSFVMAAFQPVIVLKGMHKKANTKIDLRKGLVIGQFTVSCILLIGTFIISDQLSFMREKNMGFDKEQMIILPVGGTSLAASYSTFKNKIEAMPEVVSVTNLSHDLGQKALPYLPMRVEGKEDEQMLPIMYVGHDFIKTFGLEMVQGRSFDIEHRTDSTLGFVINESAAKSLGWGNDVIGRKITFGVNGDPNAEVIGVVKDFNFDPLRSRVGPLVMGFGFASVNVAIKVKPGDHKNTLQSISKVWSEIIPGTPFTYSFLDEALTDTYRAEEKLAEIFTWFCGLAIFVASLGLFALASFSAERRLKEFGVRKVMGATEGGLVILMYREFITLIAIAFVIASPLAWYFSNEWLSNFAYRVNLSPLAYLLSIALITFVVLITVGYHSIKAAQSNPIKVLRSE